MSKHTPGPWTVIKSGVSVDAGMIRIRMEAGGWTDEVKANARLIAAAPDLLAELRIMRDWLQEQLGEWLPVEPAHYPNRQLVEMREHLDDIEAVIKKTEASA
jgi:hypothetical protein